MQEHSTQVMLVLHCQTQTPPSTHFHTNINDTSTWNNIYAAINTTKSIVDFIWWIQKSTKWLPTLRTGQPTWTASPLLGGYCLQLLLPLGVTQTKNSLPSHAVALW